MNQTEPCGKCGCTGPGMYQSRDGNSYHHTTTQCVAALKADLERLQSLLIAFGKADVALYEHEDGQGCDNLIDAHADAYKALKAEAVRLAKEAKL